uniref:Receptor ligand binding region domain-containing protein n=1 Tax=Romanomermis culicivorax TaxID=13658 RepID=A0A915HSU6_ROMCU
MKIRNEKDRMKMQYKETIAITALLASDLDVPTFGYISVSSDLENKQKYTTLIRTVNSISFMSQAVRAILLYYNWNRVVIVRVPGLTCDIFTGGFPAAFSSTKINIVSTLIVNYDDTNSINSALAQLKLTARKLVAEKYNIHHCSDICILSHSGGREHGSFCSSYAVNGNKLF